MLGVCIHILPPASACIPITGQEAQSRVLKPLVCEVQPGQKGVRIRRTDPTAPVSKQMSAGAILLSFDGVDIANDGAFAARCDCKHVDLTCLWCGCLLRRQTGAALHDGCKMLVIHT